MSEIDRLLERLERVVEIADYPGGNVSGGDQLSLDDVQLAVTTIRNLLARVDELEGALEPFAKAARTLSEVAPDGIDDELTVIARIDVMPDREERLYTADFTRAARALKGKDQDHG